MENRPDAAFGNFPGDPPSEGALREELAAYFLSVPPYAACTPAGQAAYRRQLRRLGQLEVDGILAARGTARPLIRANPVSLLQELLTAAQRLAAGVGQPVLLFPARDTRIRFCADLHPRLLQWAVVRLLRAACFAAPREPVWVRLHEQRTCLTVSFTAARPIRDAEAIAVAKESAGLHGGSLAQCDGTVAFSCGRCPEGSADDGSPVPGMTADIFMRDTLSPVWTGFYAWLEFPAEVSPSSRSSGTISRSSVGLSTDTGASVSDFDSPSSR